MELNTTHCLRTSWLPVALALVLVSPSLRSQTQPQMTPAQMENFLKTAKILKTKFAGGGTTGTLRATLSDGTFTHDAHIQSIDESQQVFKGENGTTEFNFRDSYKYNIAAYHLGLMLGMSMIPMSVERKVSGMPSAVTWWVDNVQFDEEKRLSDKIEPPDSNDWNQQVYIYRVFDQLAYNTDSNLAHLMVDKDWKIWKIDHSRSFRLQHTLQAPKNLVKCDKALLGKMKDLNEPAMLKELQPWLNKAEIKAVLARRDLIVKFFESEVQQKGEAAVLYTSARK
jgi:hypothetical protein